MSTREGADAKLLASVRNLGEEVEAILRDVKAVIMTPEDAIFTLAFAIDFLNQLIQEVSDRQGLLQPNLDHIIQVKKQIEQYHHRIANDPTLN